MAEPHNLAILAERSLDRLGDHDALVFEGAMHRSAELAARARCLAGGLAELGIAAGDRVVVLMANCPEVLITYNALWRAGAVATPVVFLVTAAELQHILIDSGAVAVVTTSDLLTTALAAARQSPELRCVIVAGGDAAPPSPVGGPAVSAYADVEGAAERPAVQREDDQLAALMYTGGTTGRAKGVALTHDNLWSCGRSAWESSHVAGANRVIIPLPLSHAYGLIVTVIGLHSIEPGLAVIQRWFNPAQWVSLCEQWRPERSTLVPAMLQMLLGEPLEDADLSSLRYISSGAAPLSLDVLREFERRVPTVEILEGYGCTESSAVISANRPGRRRVGSVGTPIAGCEVMIRDDDDTVVPAGVDGEICARSPGVMRAYWHQGAESAAAVRDGWLYTGDIGHLDSDGFLYVVDRKKDLILRGGFNVYPRDVEDALLSHPDVSMAGVVGRPDPRLGEEVVAFVSLRPGSTLSADELITYARTVISPNKCPRDIRILDSVPLTTVGKLDRKALRVLVGTAAAVHPGRVR